MPWLAFSVESNSYYVDRVREVFRRIDSSEIEGRASTIVLAEVLTVPIKASDTAIQLEYRALIIGSRGLALTPVDSAVAERAAELRARYGL